MVKIRLPKKIGPRDKARLLFYFKWPRRDSNSHELMPTGF